VSHLSAYPDIRSANAIIENLLYVGPRRQLLYVTDLVNGVPTHRFQHLACFLPALLALGVHTSALGLSETERKRHKWAAEGLANMCWAVYGDTTSGLSPDDFTVDQWTVTEHGRWVPRVEEWEQAGSPGLPPGVADLPREATPQARGYAALADAYLLRPEVRPVLARIWLDCLMVAAAGGGDILHYVADDGRCQVAGAWLVRSEDLSRGGTLIFSFVSFQGRVPISGEKRTGAIRLHLCPLP
jgi:hypothetical protein